jgi:hypothetical protein
MSTALSRKKTASVIAEMLTENTGRSILDSGNAYGRRWERNQAAGGDDPVEFFAAQPESSIEFEIWGNDDEAKVNVSVTHSLFYWLYESCEYDGEMQIRFQEFADRPENKDVNWFELIEQFPAHDCESPKGIYGDASGPLTINTYNDESMLSQVIQFTYWQDDERGQEYVLVMVHGGCDVRGGYTAPKAFITSTDYPVGILDYDRYFISCTKCEAIWSPGDDTKYNGPDFAEHIVPEIDALTPVIGDQTLAATTCTDHLLGGDTQTPRMFDVPRETNCAEVKVIERARLVLDERDGRTHDAWCPVCGKGKLSSHFN